MNQNNTKYKFILVNKRNASEDVTEKFQVQDDTNMSPTNLLIKQKMYKLSNSAFC